MGVGWVVAGSCSAFVGVEAVSLIPVIFVLVLLRGGWHAWNWENRDTSTDPAQLAPTDFQPEFQSDSVLGVTRNQWRIWQQRR